MELKVIVETVIGIIGLSFLAFGFINLIKVYREICIKLDAKIDCLEERIDQCHEELDTIDKVFSNHTVLDNTCTALTHPEQGNKER